MARKIRGTSAYARLAGVLLLALAGPGASAATPASAPSGLVWQVRGAAGTVYLAGSMHLLRADDANLPPAFDFAYRESEHLLMEIDLDDLNPGAAAVFTATHATYPPGSGLRQALGERRWQRARVEFERVGLQLETLDRLEPWAAALMYSVVGLSQLGFEPGLGVEEQLKARAMADRKPIEGLESLEYQLGLFDALSADDQARLLELTLEDSAGNGRDIDRIGTAWREGDAATLAKLLLREYRRFPTLYEALVDRRNQNWVPQIEALLKREDDCLVVVGAMHLVGERSLVTLLRARGLNVEPLRLH